MENTVDDGYQAFEEGLLKENNPWDEFKDAAEWRDWLAGWELAKRHNDGRTRCLDGRMESA